MNRVLPAIAMVACWLLLLFQGTVTLFWLVSCVTAILGLLELFKMMAPDEKKRVTVIRVLLALVPLQAVFFSGVTSLACALFISFFCTILLVLALYEHLGNVLTFLSTQGFAVFYLGVTLSYLFLIRTIPDGATWLLFLTMITGFADTGAYYFGCRFGNRKLCPQISPGKTIVGAIAGIASGTFGAFLVAYLLLPNHPLWLLLAFALILSICSGLGDLTESMIKRSCEVKDSSSLLAGHGGLLDRIDSLLLTAPILYYLLAWRGMN